MTLNPGGTPPAPPPLESFTLSPTTIGPGGVSIMDARLSRLAPMTGVQVNVTSSNPSVASVIAAGQPFIQPGCTTGGGAATIQAANSVAATTAVTISASSSSNQTALTHPLTVTAGCTPTQCYSNNCGSMPNGCGGTLQCGLCTGALQNCVNNVCT